jgi:hypothetical protein
MANTRINTTDWETALAIATRNIRRQHGPSSDYSADTFTSKHIAHVACVAEAAGDDGDRWLGLFRLYDGRFAFVNVVKVGNWDPASMGSCLVSNDPGRLISLGLDRDEREILGISISGSRRH